MRRYDADLLNREMLPPGEHVLAIEQTVQKINHHGRNIIGVDLSDVETGRSYVFGWLLGEVYGDQIISAAVDRAMVNMKEFGLALMGGPTPRGGGIREELQRDIVERELRRGFTENGWQGARVRVYSTEVPLIGRPGSYGRLNRWETEPHDALDRQLERRMMGMVDHVTSEEAFGRCERRAFALEGLGATKMSGRWLALAEEIQREQSRATPYRPQPIV